MDKSFILMTGLIGLVYLAIAYFDQDGMALMTVIGITLGFLLMGGSAWLSRWSGNREGFSLMFVLGFILGTLSAALNPFILDQGYSIPSALLILVFAAMVMSSLQEGDPSGDQWFGQTYLSVLFPYAGAFAAVLMFMNGITVVVCLVTLVGMTMAALLFRKARRPDPITFNGLRRGF